MQLLYSLRALNFKKSGKSQFMDFVRKGVSNLTPQSN